MVAAPLLEWSDHSVLSLTVRLRYDGPAEEHVHPSRRAIIKVVPQLRTKPATRLDAMLDAMLEQPNTFEDAVDRLFGVVTVRTPAITVYTDGSCMGTPGSRRSGAGIFFGPGSPKNRALRVPGRQTNNSGELYAFLYVIHDSDPCRTLLIFSDSQYGIQSVCRFALRNAQTGWKCENAEILQDIVAHIQRRPAEVRFRWVPGHSHNAYNDGADTLAKMGARMEGPVLPYERLAVPAHWPPMTRAQPRSDSHTPSEGRILKVHTTLPAQPEATLTYNLNILANEDTTVENAIERPSSKRLQELREQQYALLVRGGPDRHFWKRLRQLTGVKPRTGLVSTSALRDNFEARMNPPKEAPAHFDFARRAANHYWAACLPARTVDTTPSQCFSREWTLDDMEMLKLYLHEHHTSDVSPGADEVDLKRAMQLPNEELLELFQECIAVCGSPQDWSTALIAAITKRGVRGSALWDPKSYRTIGLESILLKMLAILVERRIREWAEEAGLLPPTQNGFRAGYRTNNNAFILRTAIEKARSEGKTLYVAFVDITNAFPSVDQPTLWAKLHRQGVRGPLIDWLRMVYSRMEYVVRHEGEYSESFQAGAGILTGDPISPILWDLYFADVTFRDHVDDVKLGGLPISHLEQADDVVLFSTSPEALQQKLDDLFHWSCVNFLEVHRTKTQCMLFGPVPKPAPILNVHGSELVYARRYAYVGITFTSTTADIFHDHLVNRADSARELANGALCVEGYIGKIPAWVARTLYSSRVDPHLTHGCEVALDIAEGVTAEFESVQHMYLRRMLGLNPRSSLAPLFTETGFLPIRFRRVILALRYLKYLLENEHLLVYKAWLEALNLVVDKKCPSWISDLWHALHNLPESVDLGPFTGWTIARVSRLIEDVYKAADTYLEREVHRSSKLLLLQGRLEWCKEGDHGSLVHITVAFRSYMRIANDAHRRALTRLYASDHPLAVEQGRRCAPKMPRDRRLCRFCEDGVSVEDETHVLIDCEAPALVQLREVFMARAIAKVPALLQSRRWLSSLEFLRAILSRYAVVDLMAAYVYDVFQLCEDQPLAYARPPRGVVLARAR